MEVTLNIKTKSEPSPRVMISGSMTFSTLEGLDDFVSTVLVARNWLRKQIAEKK